MNQSHAFIANMYRLCYEKTNKNAFLEERIKLIYKLVELSKLQGIVFQNMMYMRKPNLKQRYLVLNQIVQKIHATYYKSYSAILLIQIIIKSRNAFEQDNTILKQ